MKHFFTFCIRSLKCVLPTLFYYLFEKDIFLLHFTGMTKNTDEKYNTTSIKKCNDVAYQFLSFFSISFLIKYFYYKCKQKFVKMVQFCCLIFHVTSLILSSQKRYSDKNTCFWIRNAFVINVGPLLQTGQSKLRIWHKVHVCTNCANVEDTTNIIISIHYDIFYFLIYSINLLPI